VTCGAEFVEDALSDFGVSGRHIHVGFFDSSFLLGWHSSIKIIGGEKWVALIQILTALFIYREYVSKEGCRGRGCMWVWKK
jgi:hypothetical protein